MNEEKIKRLRDKIANRQSDIAKYEMIEKYISRYYRTPDGETLDKDGSRLIVQDKETKEMWMIDLDLLKNYGSAGYGYPVWGDVDIRKVTNSNERLTFAGSPQLLIRKNWEHIDRIQENLKTCDVNPKDKKYKDISPDFYKKAERIYVATTANSRIALYQYDGKYYISERRLLITNDGYNQLYVQGYAKIDEIFEEIEPEDISKIFGEKDFADKEFRNNRDIATEEGKKPTTIHGFDAVKEWTDIDEFRFEEQENQINSEDQISPEDIARLSKEKELSIREVNGIRGFLNRMKEAIKKAFGR